MTEPSTCACCGAVHTVGERFCAQCGASYVGYFADEEREEKSGFLAPAIERRQVTFVFCDLVGSTALSAELDPEDYTKILLTYRQKLGRAVTEFGGHVERHEGDGSLAYFGYPEAHEDDAERAVHAAIRAISDIGLIELLGRRLHARIGIATGLVVMAEIADSSEHSAMGNAPNIASRLQNVAAPDTILLEESTKRLVGGLFEFRDLGSVQLKGLVERIQAWQVIGARPAASRFEARRSGSLPPMLGRDDELQLITGLWQEARRGHGQVVLVTGEAGIGKSRLAAAVLDEANRESCAVLRYFCSPYRQGSSLHPCIQQLEHAADFSPSDSTEERFAKLETVLAGSSEEDRVLIADLVNLPVVERYPITPLSPQAKRRRTMQALVGLLERVAQSRAALMIFEDAQWSDDTSRELLLLLAGRIAQMPVLLLVLARPGFIGEWAAGNAITRCTLNPLAADVGAMVVKQVAGRRPITPLAIRDIVARTDGIPLFLEEVTQAVLELQEAPTTVADGPALSMLLRASLLPRLNRLGDAREILETASAIGREFTAEMLAFVVGSHSGLDEALDRLVVSGLITLRGGGEANYAFRHALIRDATYEMMGRERRRHLHEEIANAIESHFTDTAANYPEILAWHHTEAKHTEKAVAFWLQAGRRALLRSAMGEALIHIRRGIAVIAGAEESAWRLQNELALTIAMGMAQIATQGYAVAGTGQTFTKARAICERLGDPPPLLAVRHGLWTHALLRGQFASALDQAEEILMRGETRDDHMWRLMGHRFSGVSHFPLAQFDEAVRHLERGLSLYDPAQQADYARVTVDDPRVVMLVYLSWSLMCAGRLRDAMNRSNEAVEEAKRTGHIYTLAHALTGAAFVALTVQSPQVGLQRLDELAAVLAESGIRYYEAVETIFRGWCLASAGAFEEALPLLDAGMADYRATEAVFYLPGFLRMSAEANYHANRLDVAESLMTESLSVMSASDQRWDEAEIHRVHGKLLLAAGDEIAAVRAFQLASEIAANQGAKLWELRAQTDLAELLLARESLQDVRGCLRTIVTWFDGEPDLPDLRRARELLHDRPAGS